MLNQIDPVHNQLESNTGFFNFCIKDLTDPDFKRVIEGKGNSMQWIAGHMIASRFILAQYIGMENSWKETSKFSRGSKFEKEAVYPSISEMIATWDEISAALLKKLGELTETDVATDSKYGFPISDKTMLGGIAFLSLHDSYHMGQLGMMRKLFGYSALAD